MGIDPEVRVAKLVHDIYDRMEKAEKENEELKKTCNSLRTQNSELIDECEYLEKRIEKMEYYGTHIERHE